MIKFVNLSLTTSHHDHYFKKHSRISNNGSLVFRSHTCITFDLIDMREIKFRGLGLNRDCWFYGDLRRVEKDWFLIIPLDERPGIDKHRVRPETVGQYTGLKDKNGNEIYEGDIVMFGDTHSAPIVYSDCYFGMEQRPNEVHFIGRSMSKHLEIIGNIHETSELL